MMYYNTIILRRIKQHEQSGRIRIFRGGKYRYSRSTQTLLQGYQDSRTIATGSKLIIEGELRCIEQKCSYWRDVFVVTLCKSAEINNAQVTAIDVSDRLDKG